MAISMDALEAEIKSLKRRVEVLEKEYTTLDKEVDDIDKTQSVVTSKLNTVIEMCREWGADCALSEVFAKGGEGGLALADKVWKAMEKPNNFNFTYDVESSIPEKIDAIVKRVYGGLGADFTPAAKKQLKEIEELGFDKTQVYTTLELRMKCGIGKCGRCNIGAKYVCKDGPVFRCDELDELPNEY